MLTRSRFFLLTGSGDPRDLHSFPTRRSSDLYMAAAYRMAVDMADIRAQLEGALGAKEDFGSEKELTAEDLGKYHYTVMMEYFDDPSELAEYGRSEEHTSELQSRGLISYAVFCLKKKKIIIIIKIKKKIKKKNKK